MAARSAKYFIFWQPGAIRYLWYLFYLPMLFVPMLALLIAMSLGKPDDYRLPGWTRALWLISGALLLFVLTNDLHQLVFTFPKDASVWTDRDNGYAAGYFIVVGYQVVCAGAALVLHWCFCYSSAAFQMANAIFCPSRRCFSHLFTARCITQAFRGSASYLATLQRFKA